jgi:hypothetical protein
MVLEELDNCVHKMNVDPYFRPYIKMNLKWIIDQNVRQIGLVDFVPCKCVALSLNPSTLKRYS